MNTFTVLLWTILIQSSGSLIAYDCNQPSEVIEFSLSDVAECPELKYSYKEKISTVNVTEVQDVKEILVRSCLVEMETIISKCNNLSDALHSIPTRMIERLPVKVHLLGPEKCMIAHKNGTLIINDVSIGGINTNDVTDIRMTTLRGSLNRDGKCVGENYEQDGRRWNNVVVQVDVRVETMEYQAGVYLDSNEVKLKGGTVCTYLDGYCMDLRYGETVWDYIPEQVMHKEEHMIYNGSASIIADSNNNKYLAFETNGRIITLELIKIFTENPLYRDMEIWQTEHPRLVVRMSDIVLSSNKTFTSNVTLLNRYLNSEYVYVEKRYRKSSGYTHKEIVHRRCLHHRNIVQDRLLAAPTSNNIAKFLFKKQFGAVGEILGDILYIKQCVPKVVALRNDARCYNELPIRVDGRNMFASPVTYVIQELAEELECNSIAPPIFFIDNKCMAFNKDYVECGPPNFPVSELKSLKELSLPFRKLQPLGPNGEDLRKEIDKVRKNIFSELDTDIMKKILTRHIMHPDATPDRKLKMFKNSKAESERASSWKDKYGKVFEAFAVINAVCVILALLVYIFRTIIRCIILWKSMGFGWHILSCFSIKRSLNLLNQHKKKKEADADIKIIFMASKESITPYICRKYHRRNR